MMFWIICPTPETFPTCVNFLIWYPSRSPRPIAAPRCSACSPILTRLSWIPSTSVVLVLTAILSVRSVRLVAPFLCLFLTAPKKPVRQPLHQVVPHQHVQVWAPVVLPLHHVVAAIPRIACECHRILQRRSHFQPSFAIPDLWLCHSSLTGSVAPSTSVYPYNCNSTSRRM